MKYNCIRNILDNGEIGAQETVRGWVRTRRDKKDFSFLEINDGSCMRNIQVFADCTIEGFAENVLKAGTGAAIEAKGELVESPGKGQRVELRAHEVKLMGECAQDYPLQKKRHTNEFLRTIAHLRPRTNTFGAAFRIRHVATYAIHKYFHDNGFVCLHSPIITGSDCEGAGQMFHVTTLDLNNVPKQENSVDYTQDFFGTEANLTVSGQLAAETFACALSRVYTFGPTFRAENSNTTRHLAEFWMIEPEMAFCDLSGNAEIAQDFLQFVISYVLDHCKEDLEFFAKWYEKELIEKLQNVAKSDFESITYTDAIAALEKSGQKFEFPVKWGMDLQTEHERYLTEEYVKKPVFVTNYPREIKAFYMRVDEGGKTVSAMDLLVPRLGEIIGGSQREEREDVLCESIKTFQLHEKDYWWYLDLRKYGSVPHSGFGLGFERLLMYLTGLGNIRDVIPFPRTPGNVQF